jgi:valyl-tRNA synthetase
VLKYIFKTLLTLWHPFMPFVTEAIWETFGYDKENPLLVEKWPEARTAGFMSEKAQRFQLIIGLITAIRSLRTTYRIEPARFLTLGAEGASSSAAF